MNPSNHAIPLANKLPDAYLPPRFGSGGRTGRQRERREQEHAQRSTVCPEGVFGERLREFSLTPILRIHLFFAFIPAS